jgi:signal transduction histidine kinase
VRSWRPVAVAAIAAFATGLLTLVLAASSGMPFKELGLLGLILLPALLATSAVTALAARRQALAERQRAADRQRQDLLIAVSHDLRSPLAGLQAMVEAIDDRVVEDPATLRRYVAEMRGAAVALVGLVDDLFELVQIDAGAIAAEVERARLADVVGLAVAACEPQASGKGLAVETRLNGADDEPCSPRLARVVQNLLQNAIRHTPPDGTVRIEACRARAGVEVAVEDTGEGIAPEALERLFEPFWRGDSARKGSGSGLGLTLAKRIVDALGGEIRVETDLARGSRFEVLLPRGV